MNTFGITIIFSNLSQKAHKRLYAFSEWMKNDECCLKCFL